MVRRWHIVNKAGGTGWWRQLLSSGMNDWKVFRRTGYQQMLHCLSIRFLHYLKVSSEQASATKALTPEKARLSHRKLRATCGHLHFLLLSSHWHKTQESWGEGRSWLAVEMLWETLWKVGFSLEGGVMSVNTCVWSLPAIGGCLAEDCCCKWTEMPVKVVGFRQHGEQVNKQWWRENRRGFLASSCLPPAQEEVEVLAQRGSSSFSFPL